MRYLVTPEFTKKLGSPNSAIISHVGAIIKKIETTDENDIVSALSAYSLDDKSNNKIFVTGTGDIKIFFTFGTDNEGKYLLLLDILQYDPKTIITWLTSKQDAVKNPIYDSNLNPSFNSRINPIWNQQINPIWNKNINPIWNKNINPIWNKNINPIWNKNINPIWNKNINPIWNKNINPKINPNYKGPYIYDQNLSKEGYIVNASDDVILLFDNNLKTIGLGVKNSVGGYTLFDNHSKWIGQLVQDNQGGYLRFTDDNKWTGIAV